MIETEFRPISDFERSIILRLLELDFPGNDALKEQVRGLEAKCVDHEGSLELNVSSDIIANIPANPAVEGYYADGEQKNPFGPYVRILLHIRNGKMWLMEIYKDDGTEIKRQPSPAELELFSQHHHWWDPNSK
jgi:hypothetical protein